MQADIGRYTRPVMTITGTSSLMYLMTWVPLIAFWGAGNMPWLPLVAAAVSGIVVAMAFPAFALAVGVESYFRRRLSFFQATIPRT